VGFKIIRDIDIDIVRYRYRWHPYNFIYFAIPSTYNSIAFYSLHPKKDAILKQYYVKVCQD
jgi:hypothetical protein